MPIPFKNLGKYPKGKFIIEGDPRLLGYPKCVKCDIYGFVDKYQGRYYCGFHLNEKKNRDRRKHGLQKIKDDELIKLIDIQYRKKKLKSINLLCQ